jgi:hypothetical protein
MQDVANALLDAVESLEEDDGDVSVELEFELEGIPSLGSGARKTLEGIRYQVFCTETPPMRTLRLVSRSVL